MKTFLFIIFFSFCAQLTVDAQEENAIASFIYNFTRYVNWPSDDGGDFMIDVIGHKSVYDKLKEICAGRKVGNKNISVRFLETPANITRSHILFVGFWQSKDMPKVIDKVNGSPTLIVSEKDGLIDAGSDINFIVRNNSIKYEIKKSNIVKRGLTISETLLSLAYKAY